MSANGYSSEKKYQAKQEVFFDDGREVELLHFVYGHADLEQIRNSPQRVLDTIDEFARSKKYLMNVGEDKGSTVADLIRENRPEIMVELGGYVGYSAILFGDALRQAGGKQYYCLERNAEFGAVIASLVDLAGLRDTVRVVIGPSHRSIRRLHESGTIKRIDMMFIDHYKPAYTTDVKLCETLELIQPGTVLAADNVIEPGNPPYLEYVRSTCAQKRDALKSGGSGSTLGKFRDATSQQYRGSAGEESLDENQKGNPNLIYESRLINGFEPSGEPDGVEVTRCVGVEKEET